MERGTLKNQSVNRLLLKANRSNESIVRHLFEQQADKLWSRAKRLPKPRKVIATKQLQPTEFTLEQQTPLDQAERLSDQLSAENLPPSPPQQPQKTPTPPMDLTVQRPHKTIHPVHHHCDHPFDPRGAIVSSDPLLLQHSHTVLHRHRYDQQPAKQQPQQSLSAAPVQQIQQDSNLVTLREQLPQQHQQQQPPQPSTQPPGQTSESEPLHQTSSPFAVGSVNRHEPAPSEPDPRLYSYENDPFEYDQLSTDPSIDQVMLGSLHADPVTRVGRLPTTSTSSVDTSHPSLRMKAMPAKYSISMASGKSDSLAVRRMPSTEDIEYVWGMGKRRQGKLPPKHLGKLTLPETGAVSSLPSPSHPHLHSYPPVTGMEERKFINARMKIITGQDLQPIPQYKLDRYTKTGWATTSTGGTATTRSPEDSLKVKPMLSKEDIGQACRGGKGARIESASLDLGHYSHMSRKLSVGQSRSKKAWATHCTRYRPLSSGSSSNNQKVS